MERQDITEPFSTRKVVFDRVVEPKVDHVKEPVPPHCGADTLPLGVKFGLQANFRKVQKNVI